MSKSETTRQTLIEAFCLLYREKPLDKITVQAITRKAGYNRSTFYQYFFDVYDLLDFVEQDTIEYIIQNRKDERKVDSDIFLENLVTLYNDRKIYVEALMGDYGINRFLMKLMNSMNEIIPELNIPDDDPLKEYRIQYRISTSLSLFRLWIKRGKDLSVDELLQLVWNLYIKGSSSLEAI